MIFIDKIKGKKQNYMEIQSNRFSLPLRNSTEWKEPEQQMFMGQSVSFAVKKLQHINCIEEGTSFYGALYLGDIVSILKPEVHTQHRITAVLSCLSDAKYKTIKIPQNMSHLYICAKDTLDYPIGQHFNQTYHFIETMRQQGHNVLVHCHAGISRSAALVCAYLMRKWKWRVSEAFKFVRGKRERVKPNDNFMNILLKFQEELFHPRKITMIQSSHQEKPTNSNQQNRQIPLFNRIKESIKGNHEIGRPKRILQAQEPNHLHKSPKVNFQSSLSAAKFSKIGLTSPTSYMHESVKMYRSPQTRISMWQSPIKSSLEMGASLKPDSMTKHRNNRTQTLPNRVFQTLYHTRHHAK